MKIQILVDSLVKIILLWNIWFLSVKTFRILNL